MVLFAEYCFSQSHSTAYGAVTYQTAYLKAHYPVAYMAALLTERRRCRQSAALHLQLQCDGGEVMPPAVLALMNEITSNGDQSIAPSSCERKGAKQVQISRWANRAWHDIWGITPRRR